MGAVTIKRAQGYLEYVYFEGWDYVRQPPAAVASEQYLTSADPWLVFCCILERAKVGDFENVDRLASLWQTEDDYLAHAAQYLLAAVGREEQLQAFDGPLLSEDFRFRMELADHAAVSGSLRFVDVFIAAYRLAFGETTRMAMEEGLSGLLTADEEARPVANLLWADDRPAGEAALRQLALEQAKRFGPRLSFYAGKPLTPESIITEIQETLDGGNPGESLAHLQGLVTRLQTLFGFSQVGMFDDDGGTWDSELIRSQLGRLEQVDFEPGVRTFFGHRAPL